MIGEYPESDSSILLFHRHIASQLGITLYPWQEEIITDGPERLLVRGPRRSGLTAFSLIYSLAECLRRWQRVLLVYPSWRLRNISERLMSSMESLQAASNLHQGEVSRYLFQFPTGASIQLCNQGLIPRGDKYTLVISDNAGELTEDNHNFILSCLPIRYFLFNTAGASYLPDRSFSRLWSGSNHWTKKSVYPTPVPYIIPYEIEQPSAWTTMGLDIDTAPPPVGAEISSTFAVLCKQATPKGIIDNAFACRGRRTLVGLTDGESDPPQG